jgi:DNA-binding MarR family transcriptional regulator
VPLTINGTPTDPPARNPSSGEDDAARRQQIVGAVRDELLSWNPREFISAFRRWHRGSFSLIHLNVLTMLEADGPMSMSGLAEALDVSVASTTGIVDRMEKRGLVERRHEERDRRVVLVYPTEAGRDVFREIDERRRLGLGLLLETLSVDELEGLLKGHRALRIARAEAAAARPAAAAGPSGSAEPGTSGTAASSEADATLPSRFHRASTIAREHPPVDPLTGAGR